MRFYWLVLAALGVWRITHLLNAEDGPWKLLTRFRQALGDGHPGRLVDCFYCLSLWIAIPFAFAIGLTWKERLLLWPALSGAAILLQRITTTPEGTAPALYVEDKEPPDVLRPQSNDQTTASISLLRK